MAIPRFLQNRTGKEAEKQCALPAFPLRLAAVSGVQFCSPGEASAPRVDVVRSMKAAPSEDAGYQRDFDALVEQYEKRIFNLVFQMLGDYEEAADVTQETFINAFRHYGAFRGESQVFTWLYQIARNLCINRIRQRERRKHVRMESLDQTQLPDEEGITREVPDYTHAPQKVLEEKELGERIHAAIEALPMEYREVVMLREFQHLSYNEIAEATGLTLENVKTRLSRARAMLRRKLEPYFLME